MTLGALAFLQHSRDWRFRSAAAPAPRIRHDAAFRSLDSMGVASTPYEGDADPLPGVTAVRSMLCRIKTDGAGLVRS